MKTKTIRFLVYQLLTLGIIMILLVSSTVQAEELVINDTFDSASNWELATYSTVWNESWNSFELHKNSSVDVANIVDGKLKFTDSKPLNDSYFDADFGLAKTPSTTSFGRWSFDFEATNGLCRFAFIFTFTMYGEFEGVPENAMRAEGFGIITFTDPINDKSSIKLLKYTNQDYGFQYMGNQSYIGQMSGVNHYDIERYTNGSVMVYYNHDLVFDYYKSEGPEKSSEIWFLNWHGDTQIDDLQVTDFESDSDTGGLPLNVIYVFFGIVAGILTINFTYKKGKKNF